MNISTSHTILVTFRSETSEFIAPFAAIQQKSAYHANTSEYPRPTLTYFTDLVGVLVGMIFQVFVWRSPKGHCYGYIVSKFGELSFSNLGVYAVKTRNFCRDSPAI